MKLDTKKQLAARTLGVGKDRVIFVESRIEEIKEAITKQDIRDLHKEGAILLREIKGKKIVVRRKRKGPGRIKKKVNTRKQEYVKNTRKQRKIVAENKRQGTLAKEEVKDIRNKIRNRIFKSAAALKLYIRSLKK